MGNCLKTQLKAVVDNPALPKLGELILNVVPKTGTIDISSTAFNIINSKDFTIDATDGAHLVTNFADINDSSKWIEHYDGSANENIQLFVCNTAGKIKISEKYTLKTIGYKGDCVFNCNIDDLKLSDSLEWIGVGYESTGDISSLLDKPLKSVYLGSSKITGSSIAFGSTIETISIEYTSIGGTLSEVASCTNLQYMILPNTNVTNGSNVSDAGSLLGNLPSLNNVNILNTNITGSIEGFVAARGGTNTTGVPCNGFLKLFTFGGVTHPDAHQGTVLTWNASEGKIAAYAGWTTSSATTVYCKGYTQQEAEAAFAGKTIVRVDA